MQSRYNKAEKARYRAITRAHYILDTFKALVALSAFGLFVWVAYHLLITVNAAIDSLVGA